MVHTEQARYYHIHDGHWNITWVSSIILMSRLQTLEFFNYSSAASPTDISPDMPTRCTQILIPPDVMSTKLSNPSRRVTTRAMWQEPITSLSPQTILLLMKAHTTLLSQQTYKQLKPLGFFHRQLLNCISPILFWHVFWIVFILL